MKVLVVLILVVLACGQEPIAIPPTSPSDGGILTYTYTKVYNPNDKIAYDITYDQTPDHRVVAPAGVARLLLGTVPGTGYVVASEKCPVLLEDLAAIYSQGPRTAVDIPITTAAFGLYDGTQLPASRCVIVGNCFETVCAYQDLEPTFQ